LVRALAGETLGKERGDSRIDTAPLPVYLVWCPNQRDPEEDAVHRFLQRHAAKVIGVLSGFDRLVFRGTLRRLAYAAGLRSFLWDRRILFTEFPDYAKSLTDRLKQASLREAEEHGRPVVYLPSSRTSKEEVARKIAEKDGVEEGLIAVLSSVEPCTSFEVHRNRETKKRELRAKTTKCLHLYHYGIDPVFGFSGARIQTWFPFSIQVTVNGREWLARELDRAGIAGRREGNCFPFLEDVDRVQRIFDRQLRVYLPRLLDRVARRLNPDHGRMFRGAGLSYYWSVHQSEWATDVMFDAPASLAAIYPSIVRHAMNAIGSGEVMRFLGGKVGTNFQGQIVSDFKNRPEGVRVKHRVEGNSVKAYDKAGSILRVETTINDPSRLKVFRRKEGDRRGKPDWRPMRKGVADTWRRAELSQRANERYLDTLSAADTSRRVGDLFAQVSRRVRWKGRFLRALRPSDPLDKELFRLLGSGELALEGLRNRDVQRAIFPKATRDPIEKRRRSARATRLLRLLRAHALVRKVPRTHRYQVTDKGIEISAAVLATQAATMEQLAAA
jgi:hypothetical protein